MRVQIVARHCEIPASVRERAEEQMRKLVKYDPTISSAEVIFSEERHLKQVEAIVLRDGDARAVAHGENGEFRKSLDQAVNRLAKILRRHRAQVRDHQGPPLSEAAVIED